MNEVNLELFGYNNTFVGIPHFMEFTNEDGNMPDYNCGQAAVATLAHYYGMHVGVKELEERYGPNIMLGYLGTSRLQIERCLTSLELKPVMYDNMLQFPCITLHQFEYTKKWGISIPSGHWMVVFGADKDYYYVSNWPDNKISKEEFDKGQGGLLVKVMGMSHKSIGLV
jgi:ABC-type bacteriocin/lantibiotic exporter with double-glycine peptidase domain